MGKDKGCDLIVPAVQKITSKPKGPMLFTIRQKKVSSNSQNKITPRRPDTNFIDSISFANPGEPTPNNLDSFISSSKQKVSLNEKRAASQIQKMNQSRANYENRLSNASIRAMTRESDMSILFNKYLMMKGTSISIRPLLMTELCSKDATFGRLLESIAITLDKGNFTNTHSLQLQFTLRDRILSYSLSLMLNGAYDDRPQLHIKLHNIMMSYDDVAEGLCRKHQGEKPEIIMRKLLDSTMRNFQKTLDDYADEPCLVNVMSFLLLTHIAENYRPGRHGQLTEHDCSPPSSKESPQLTTPRILSRVPGSGKWTRSYIDLIILNKATFSILDMKEYLPFVKKGGTSEQRRLAVNLRPMTTYEEDINENMSSSSEEQIVTILKQLKIGQKGYFDFCIGFNKIDIEITYDGKTFLSKIVSIDIDSSNPLTRKELETMHHNIMVESIKQAHEDSLEYGKFPLDFNGITFDEQPSKSRQSL